MSALSRRVRSFADTRAMLTVLLCMLAAAAAAPYYDQRQDGESNYRADVQNIVFIVAYPKNILNGLYKSSKQQPEVPEVDAQDRSDVQVMEAFVEPSKPYGVEISSEADGRAAEVVIAGRRRIESDIQPEMDEYKLIGATEQCGPDRQRDPETLMCIAVRSTNTPEVVMSAS